MHISHNILKAKVLILVVLVITQKIKICPKLVCEHNKFLCKKHYKLHLKKMEKNKKMEDIK